MATKTTTTKSKEHPLQAAVRGNFDKTRLIKVDVTPEIATSLLEECNIGNRGLRPAHVRKFAQLINEDRFVEANPLTPIGLDTDGILLNGQHRLAAIAKTGKPQSMYFVLGVEPHFFGPVDQLTKNKKVSDYMKKAGYTHFKDDHASVLRFMVKGFKASSGPGGFMYNHEFEEAYKKHQEAVDFAVAELSVPKSHPRSRGLGRAGLRAAIAVAYEQPELRKLMPDYVKALRGEVVDDKRIRNAAEAQSYWLQDHLHDSFAQAAQVELLARALHNLGRMVQEDKPIEKFSPSMPKKLAFTVDDADPAGAEVSKRARSQRKGGRRKKRTTKAA